MFWVFEKAIFQFSCKYFSDEVQTVFWENEAERSELLKSKFHKMKLLLENGFQATLSPKTNVLSIWKGHFPVFCKLLSDKVETVFWENKAKQSRLFKLKFGHGKLLRKWFWSCLELNNQCSEHLKRSFFSFSQIFEWRN